MNVRPVIIREMRVQARYLFTYWVRVLAAGVLLLSAYMKYEDTTTSATAGMELFASLHVTLYALVWLLVPLLTADCLSREKRQGTLGLLFLTPLKAGEIVAAKGLVYGLRCLTMCLAVLPVLTIPFLIGGIAGSQALVSLLMQMNAFCLALAAGVLASAFSVKWFRALVFAEILGLLFQLLSATIYGILLIVQIQPSGFYHHGLTESILRCLAAGLWCTYGKIYVTLTRIGPITPSGWVLITGATLGISVLLCILFLRLAARKIRRSWQEEPPSAARVWAHQTFCEPMFLLPLFRWWMRRKLLRNPIGWLEQRSWQSRVITWIWLAVLISLYSAALPDAVVGFRNFLPLHNYVAIGLMISIAITSAGSFQRERETGVLELLLVSPLSTRQIMAGRLRGIWGQFGLSIILLLFLWAYMASLFQQAGWGQTSATEQFKLMFFYFCAFFTLPVIGLYYSLAQRQFVTALFSSLLVGAMLPMYLGGVVARFAGWFDEPSFAGYLVFFPSLRIRGAGIPAGIIALVLGSWFFFRLYWNLQQRKFALHRTS